MSCSAYLTDLSTAIWNDLGQPTDMPVSYIQSKLTSNAFLGKLNNLTTNCHTIVSGDISPVLDINEQSLYSLMYQADFYTTKVNNLMDGNAISFTTIQDGDSRITRVSSVDMARLYRDMQKELNAQLNSLTLAYRQADSLARSVNYLGIDNTWRGTMGYGSAELEN